MKKISIGILFIFFAFNAFSQNIYTADEYLEQMSQKYGTIDDYEADVIITQAKTEMTGKLWYKKPGYLRIDFTEPAQQVLNVNNGNLTVYIPKFSVVLEQELPKRSEASLASMASSQGLTYLVNNYKVAYVVGPDPVPLKEGSDEMVVKLKFYWKSTAEGFKEIIISFNNNGLIRNVLGKTSTDKAFEFDFLKIRINQHIPVERFNYNPPAWANSFKDFLFEGNE
ncbi:MAG: outer membrane lipoprotein carrier protein LolA [Spirochaetales bacterium]|nr:outer membrane lipoprotein carrier protein LolA [Spirochaetales bacterium]